MDSALDAGQQQVELELDEVDVGDRDDDIAAQHDTLVEHAADKITEDQRLVSVRQSDTGARVL